MRNFYNNNNNNNNNNDNDNDNDDNNNEEELTEEHIDYCIGAAQDICKFIEHIGKNGA